MSNKITMPSFSSVDVTKQWEYSCSMDLLFRLTIAFVSTSLFVLIDWFSVRWYETGSIMYVPILLALALCAYWTFGWVTHMTSLSTTSGLINTGIVVGSILVGVFIRKDVLDLQQKIGLLTAIASVGLLTIHR